MQTFPFTLNGKDYVIYKLTDKVKSYITDRMTAERVATVNRLFREELISNDDYLLEKENSHVKWGSIPFATMIRTEKYGMMLIRQVLEGSDKLTDDELFELQDTDEFKDALELMMKESEAKK